MRNKTTARNLVGLATLTALTLWLLKQVHQSLNDSERFISLPITHATAIPDSILPANTLATEKNQISSSLADATNTTFEHTVTTCYPDLTQKIHSPTEFVKHWQSIHPQSSQDMDFVRYFFKDRKNNEIRAHVLYTVTSGRTVRELKIFKVLEDGLPDPVGINSKDQYNPSNTALTKYIDFSTVFEIQKKWSSRDQDFLIEVEESNGQVIEFQAWDRHSTFRCHENDCECLKKP